MARELRLEIEGDSKSGRRALDDVADEADKTARKLEQLGREFKETAQEGGWLERNLKATGRQARETGASLGGLSRQADDAADELSSAARAALKFDAALATTRAEVDKLSKEFGTTGNLDVAKQLQKQYAELDRISRLKQRLAKDDEQVAKRATAAATTMKLLGTETIGTGEYLKGIEKNSNALKVLDTRIKSARAEVRKLGEQFVRTGSVDVWDHLNKSDTQLRALTSMRKKLASAVGDGIGDGVQGAARSPGIGQVGLALGAAIAVPLGAAIGGAVTAGAGAGVAGLGVAGAIMGDPERFKTAWAAATADVKQDFLEATAIFGGPLLDALGGIGPLVDSWHIDTVFADAAKYVGPLVHGIEGLATGVVKGVGALVRRAEPAVQALSNGMVELGEAAEYAFEHIADGAEGGADALRDTLTAVSLLVRGTGLLVEGFENVYEYVHDHPIESAFGSAGLTVPITLLDLLGGKYGEIGDLSDTLAGKGQAAFYGIDQAERDALATVQRLNDAWDDSRNKILGLSNANIAVARDYAELNKQFEGGAHALDINYEKGQNNLELINDTIADLIRQRDAAIAAGGGTQAAYDKANAAFNAQLQHLEDMLVKLGLTRQAAHALMAEFYDKTITVTVKVRQVGSVSKEGVVSGGDQRRNVGSAYAGGGTVDFSGVKLVGEQGPELAWLSKGQYVSTAQQTRQLMSMMPAGSGGSSTPAAPAAMPPMSQLEQAFAMVFMYLAERGQLQVPARAVV